MKKKAVRKKYDREFKEETVRMVLEGKRTVSQMADDLGINRNMLHRWVRKYLDNPAYAFPGKGHQPPLEEENKKLKRENDILKQEREILKKALSIFSKSPR
jgi:transposase